MPSQSLADRAMAAFLAGGGANGKSLADLALAGDLPVESGKLLNESHADVTVANTVAETNLFNLAFPVGLLVPGDNVLVTAGGELTFNFASTLIWKLWIGNANMLTTPALAYPVSAQVQRWFLLAAISMRAVNDQRVAAMLALSQPTAATWDVVNLNSIMVGTGTSNQDLSTGPWGLQLSNVFGAANAGLSNTCRFASMTLLEK